MCNRLLVKHSHFANPSASSLQCLSKGSKPVTADADGTEWRDGYFNQISLSCLFTAANPFNCGISSLGALGLAEEATGT